MSWLIVFEANGRNNQKSKQNNKQTSHQKTGKKASGPTAPVKPQPNVTKRQGPELPVTSHIFLFPTLLKSEFPKTFVPSTFSSGVPAEISPINIQKNFECGIPAVLFLTRSKTPVSKFFPAWFLKLQEDNFFGFTNFGRCRSVTVPPNQVLYLPKCSWWYYYIRFIFPTCLLFSCLILLK